MKNFCFLLILSFFVVNIYSTPKINFEREQISPDVIRKQVLFNPNRLYTWIQNTGIFNQDKRTSNTPGLMWPAGSNRFAFFTTGLTIGAKVNNAIRLASCSYSGEYAPGFMNGGAPDSNSYFKLYKITRGDGPSNSDWANWFRMVPYGAPYYDVNNNSIYEQGIDTPGVRNAQQTVFICMTDGFASTHNQSEGFSGGTAPLFAEMHLTAWGYDKTEYSDMHFLKFEIINKGNNIWDSTYMAIINDPDLGDAGDDYIGCDTVRELGYVLNSDNYDGNGYPPSYGLTPPAAGIIMLKGVRINGANPINLNMTTFTYFTGTGAGGITCEQDPSLPKEAYYYLQGRKKDGSHWVHPFYKTRVRLVYTGEPEANTGWTEYGYNGNQNMGMVKNCNGGDTLTTFPCPPGDRRYCIGTGAGNLVVNPGDTQKIIICQLVARGTNNLNSVTKLKQLSDVAWSLYYNNFVIGIQNISNELPSSFALFQNYPNPFNPVTTIRFDVAENGKWKSVNETVTLKVYDVLGKEIAVLVNERLKPGAFEVKWNASGFGSGIYFYRLSAGDFNETKKMIILK
ncbi:MAG TPA: T9SS type A sorting domain-containing protein [Ignavibacteria bacterium]|nr:T9SS type A sorting domain-containing protein [Ignavibacteria bacterium]